MRIRVGCEFEYASEAAVPMLMMVRAQPDDGQHTLYESRWTEPRIAVRDYVDAFDNHCWRFTAPTGPFRIRYDAVVATSSEPDLVVPDAPLVPVEDLPDVTLVYTLASRYIQSDLLVSQAWDIFGGTPPNWQRVQAICDWVHTNVSYETAGNSPSITALDVFERRIGVCRDFALLAIAFCRALNIPARYTFGYLPDIAVEPPDVPMDFHTWFEAYVGGRWYTFDARHNTPRVGRVVIGRGRDAVDCALSTAYGSARLAKFTVWSDEITAERPGGPPLEEDADSAEAAARARP